MNDFMDGYFEFFVVVVEWFGLGHFLKLVVTISYNLCKNTVGLSRNNLEIRIPQPRTWCLKSSKFQSLG